MTELVNVFPKNPKKIYFYTDGVFFEVDIGLKSTVDKSGYPGYLPGYRAEAVFYSNGDVTKYRGEETLDLIRDYLTNPKGYKTITVEQGKLESEMDNIRDIVHGYEKYLGILGYSIVKPNINKGDDGNERW